MQKLPIAIAFLFLCIATAESQTAGRSYRAWASLRTGETIKHAYLEAVTDSTVVLAVSKNAGKLYEPLVVPAANLQSLSIRSRGQVGRGALWGGLAGLAAGMFVGRLAYEPCPDCFIDLGPGYHVAAGALIGTPIGVATGMALGAIRRKFTINGDPASLRAQRAKIEGR